MNHKTSSAMLVGIVLMLHIAFVNAVQVNLVVRFTRDKQEKSNQLIATLEIFQRAIDDLGQLPQQTFDVSNEWKQLEAAQKVVQAGVDECRKYTGASKWRKFLAEKVSNKFSSLVKDPSFEKIAELNKKFKELVADLGKVYFVQGDGLKIDYLENSLGEQQLPLSLVKKLLSPSLGVPENNGAGSLSRRTTINSLSRRATTDSLSRRTTVSSFSKTSSSDSPSKTSISDSPSRTSSNSPLLKTSSSDSPSNRNSANTGLLVRVDYISIIRKGSHTFDLTVDLSQDSCILAMDTITKFKGGRILKLSCISEAEAKPEGNYLNFLSEDEVVDQPAVQIKFGRIRV